MTWFDCFNSVLVYIVNVHFFFFVGVTSLVESGLHGIDHQYFLELNRIEMFSNQVTSPFQNNFTFCQFENDFRLVFSKSYCARKLQSSSVNKYRRIKFFFFQVVILLIMRCCEKYSTPSWFVLFVVISCWSVSDLQTKT